MQVTRFETLRYRAPDRKRIGDIFCEEPPSARTIVPGARYHARMDYTDVVASRRMVRSFSDVPVDGQVLLGLLDQARRAPSAGFAQGVDFIVLRGERETERWWEATTTPDWWERNPRRSSLRRAPCIVIPLANMDRYRSRYSEPDKMRALRAANRSARATPDSWPVPYWFGDAAFATMLLLLGAVDSGLGAAFLGCFRGEQQLRRALLLPGSVKVFGAVLLGHPAPDDPPGSPTTHERRDLRSVVHWGAWNGDAPDP